MSEQMNDKQVQERQEKQKQFSAQSPKKSSGKLIALLSVILVSVVALGAWFSVGDDTGDGFTKVKSVSGEVRIDLDRVSDGKAHYFKFSGNRGEIRFFVVKSVDGVIRAAFDACDVCYREKKGYRQEGDSMVCNNCGQRFRTDLVNEVKGGCNPAPLTRRIDGRQLVISESNLLSGHTYFADQG